MELNIEQIKELIPHRYPFCWWIASPNVCPANGP